MSTISWSRRARECAMPMLALLVLVGCGGGGGSAAAPPVNNNPPVNNPPVNNPPPAEPVIEGVATPSSVAVVTATNAQ
jgi:hypothetical protein